MGPFRVTFKPVPLKTPGGDNTNVLWRSRQILQHIYSRISLWGLGGNGQGSYHFIREEMSRSSNIRSALKWMEDEYVLFPRHRNVLHEALCYLTQSQTNNKLNTLDDLTPAQLSQFPEQQTHIALNTPYRTMDLQLNFIPSREKFETWIANTGNEDDEDEFDVFSGEDQNNETKKDDDSNSNDVKDSNVIIHENNNDLQQRIIELEEQNKRLANLLLSHGIIF